MLQRNLTILAKYLKEESSLVESFGIKQMNAHFLFMFFHHIVDLNILSAIKIFSEVTEFSSEDIFSLKLLFPSIHLFADLNHPFSSSVPFFYA